MTARDYEGLSPSFAALCREADKAQRRKPADPHLELLRHLMRDDISLEQAWRVLNAAAQRGQAAASTVESLAYALRERGKTALDRDVNRQRLAQLSEQQLKDLIVRMRREQSKYPDAPITDALLCFLAELLP